MLEKIKELLAKQLRIDIDAIADDSNIIEDDLGVIISDDDAVRLKTVRDVADYIEANA